MKSIVNNPNDDDGCRAFAHAADEKSEVHCLLGDGGAWRGRRSWSNARRGACELGDGRGGAWRGRRSCQGRS